MSSDPGAPEADHNPTALPPPARILRLVMLGVLEGAERVDFKFLAVFSRKFGSSDGRPASVAEQVHALAWLIDRGFVRMQARQARDGFWEKKREQLSFSLDARGSMFLQRMYLERWEDESPEYAVLEEGGPELSPGGAMIEQHITASLQVGTSEAYPALEAPVRLPDPRLSPPLTVLVWGLVAVSVVALLYLLLFGGR